MTKLLLVTASPASASSLPDAHARRQALDVEHSWLVEAPAGSGKTGLLIQRFLKLLAHHTVTRPEQILAITFTVKATVEIRERILAHLERARNPSSPPPQTDFDYTTRQLALQVLERDTELGWNLLLSPGRLNIRTIDSINAEIARALPILSGSGGAISPSSDPALLHHEAARRTLMLLGGSDSVLSSALNTLLLHRNADLADCQAMIAQMLSLRDQWIQLVPIDAADITDTALDANLRPRLERALVEIVSSELSLLLDHFPQSSLERLTMLAAQMADLPGYNGLASPLTECASRLFPPAAHADHVPHWRALLSLIVTNSATWRKSFNRNHLRFELTPPHRQELKALVEELQSYDSQDHLCPLIGRILKLPPVNYPEEQWTVLKALFRILRHSLAELQLVFAERRECDFTELGLLARSALLHEHGASDFDSAVGVELQHLLVDEMQDTSTGQYHLLELLTDSWDGHSQTVFLVGDPKQSIYLFRQARVERFVDAMANARLGSVPLTTLHLTANFRSRPSLVQAFNHDFSLIFPPDSSSPSTQIIYQNATALRESDAHQTTPCAVWHTSLLPCPPQNQSSGRLSKAHSLKDAEQIRAIIEQWRHRPLPPGRTEPWKIAVLIRDRNHLLDIVSVLKRTDASGSIPIRAIDIDPLDECPEVLDLVAITRSLLHPADRTAWLSLLRAPWCGLRLSDIHLLTSADQPQLARLSVLDVIVQRRHLLPREANQHVSLLVDVMSSAVSARDGSSIAQWVERTWRALAGDASLTAQQLSNADRYFQLLDDLESRHGDLNLTLLERKLSDLYAAPSLEPGAVELLTIHKAKGLEWDVVLLPALHRRARPNGNRLLSWEELDVEDPHAAPVIFAPVTGKGAEAAALNLWVSGLHNARELAERKRLFYVACTRAREELHLFASPELKKSGEVRLESGSLLQAAWAAAAAHFNFDAPVAEALGPPSLSLAAAADSITSSPRTIDRLPLSSRPTVAPVSVPAPDPLPASRRESFMRPEASFAARSFGNAVHTFLDLAARRLAAADSPQALVAAVDSWLPRIHAILRNDGLAPATAGRLAPQVQTALKRTLEHPEGLWLLSPHPMAASEFAINASATQPETLRLDRIFLAGSEPLSPGFDHLWIVDYKTATHGPEDLDLFLAEQTNIYAPQLERYAAAAEAAIPGYRIRLALYYPLLSRLTWWPATSGSPQTVETTLDLFS